MKSFSAKIPALTDIPPWQRTLFILAFAQLVSSLGFSNIFPFLPYYIQDLGTNTSLSLEFWVGMVFTAQGTTMMIAAPIWGAIADRYGRKLMVERATFGGAIIFLLMAFARSAEELVLLRAVQGMVTGVVAAVNALAISGTPRDRTGFAVGVLQVSRWGGISIGPLMGGFIADWLGFRPTFFVTTALLFLAGVLVWRGVEEDFTPAPSAQTRFGFVAEWRGVLTTPGVGLTYLFKFMNGLSRMLFLPLIPLFVQLILSNTARASTFTGLVLGVSSAAGTVSTVYLGRLGDRKGHRRILIASTFVAGGLYLAQAWVTQGWQFLVLQGLSGMALGGILPALGALLAQYTQPGEEGAVYGLDNAIIAASRAVAPMIGVGVAAVFSLRGSIVLVGLILLFNGALAVLRLPEIKPQQAEAAAPGAS